MKGRWARSSRGECPGPACEWTLQGLRTQGQLGGPQPLTSWEVSSSGAVGTQGSSWGWEGCVCSPRWAPGWESCRGDTGRRGRAGAAAHQWVWLVRPKPSRRPLGPTPTHPHSPGRAACRQALLLPWLSLGPPLLTLPSVLRRRGRALGGPSPLLTSITQTWEASWLPTPPLWRWRQNHPRGMHNCSRPPLRPGLSTGQGPASLPEPRGRRVLCDRVSEDVLLVPGPQVAGGLPDGGLDPG